MDIDTLKQNKDLFYRIITIIGKTSGRESYDESLDVCINGNKATNEAFELIFKQYKKYIFVNNIDLTNADLYELKSIFRKVYVPIIDVNLCYIRYKNNGLNLIFMFDTIELFKKFLDYYTGNSHKKSHISMTPQDQYLLGDYEWNLFTVRFFTSPHHLKGIKSLSTPITTDSNFLINNELINLTLYVTNPRRIIFKLCLNLVSFYISSYHPLEKHHFVAICKSTTLRNLTIENISSIKLENMLRVAFINSSITRLKINQLHNTTNVLNKNFLKILEEVHDVQFKIAHGTFDILYSDLDKLLFIIGKNSIKLQIRYKIIDCDQILSTKLLFEKYYQNTYCSYFFKANISYYITCEENKITLNMINTYKAHHTRLVKIC